MICEISISVSTSITITTVAVALRTTMYIYYLKRNKYLGWYKKAVNEKTMATNVKWGFKPKCLPYIIQCQIWDFITKLLGTQISLPQFRIRI